jgi:hypothetical protein
MPKFMLPTWSTTKDRVFAFVLGVILGAVFIGAQFAGHCP